MTRKQARLYRIKPHPDTLLQVGLTRDRRQTLIGLCCARLVAFFFNAEGDLVDSHSHPLEFLQLRGGPVGGEPLEGQVQTYNIHDPRILTRLRTWQAELGFRARSIEVKQFFSEEMGIGIQDYPDDFQEVLNDPAASEEDRSDVQDALEAWHAEGQFVLLWGKDYWLDRLGDVVSS